MKKINTSFSIIQIGTLLTIGCFVAAFMPLALFIGPIGLVARIAS